jgi:general secretion pathway protein L
MQVFLQWWLKQLASILPEGRRGASSPPPDASVLEIDRDTTRLLIRFRGTTERLAEAPANETGLAGLTHAISTASNLPRRLLLRPVAAAVLKKRIVLPVAAQGNLEDVLGFEIDRETPFNRDEVYWTYSLDRQASGPMQLAVDLAFVPRFYIDVALNAARAAGLAPIGIEVESGHGASTFIPLGARTRTQWIGAEWPLLPFGAAAAALALLAIATPFGIQQWAFASAEAAIIPLSAPAHEAGALRRAADQRMTTVAFLNEQRRQNGSAVALLAAVTRALPDDTYLRALNLRGGKLTITGSSPSAAGLIAILGETPEFRDPSFEAPVVQNADSGLETFTISVALKPEDAP